MKIGGGKEIEVRRRKKIEKRHQENAVKMKRNRWKSE